MITKTGAARHILTVIIAVIVCTVSVVTAQEPESQAADSSESTTTPDPGSIARAQFTTSVVDREPVDGISLAFSNIEELYFFSELLDMQGQTVSHRWRHFGSTVAEVSFEVKGPRWRVFSYKTINQDLIGELSVELIDGNGLLLEEHSIAIIKPDPSAKPPEKVAQKAKSPAQQANESNDGSPLNSIFSTFPNAYYTLVNDSMTLGKCPPSGTFSWQQIDDKTWHFILSADKSIPVRDSDSDTSPMQPLSNYPEKSECVTYTSHKFSRRNNELEVDLQYDCTGGENDVFTTESIQKKENILDVTIFDKELMFCRYQL